MIRRIIALASLVALLTTASLIAQTFRGGVAGAVTDATGPAVPGAAIKLVSPDTGLTRESTAFLDR